MPTPQITLRVEEDRLARWKEACACEETNISEQVRFLMDNWADLVLRSQTTSNDGDATVGG